MVFCWVNHLHFVPVAASPVQDTDLAWSVRVQWLLLTSTVG